MRKRILSIVLSLMLILTMFCGMTGTAFAGTAEATPFTAKLTVDGKNMDMSGYTIEGYKYFKLRDLAYAVNGSSKQFNVAYDAKLDAVNLVSGQAYAANGSEMKAVPAGLAEANTAVPGLYHNGKRLVYTLYTVADNTYIRLSDLAQIVNTYAVYDTTSKATVVNTKKNFTTDFKTLTENGYFDFLHGAVLGNAETGQIIYGSNADQKVSIASTSKLMTYLLVKEAIDAKKISLEDQVTLSKVAEANSRSEDGVIPMTAGQKAKVSDLITAMLVVSSNESATALAEHVAGSEAAFTNLMNAKAKELELKTAEFYNPHGLPSFTADVLSAKRQNRMSAGDLFKLSKHVIDKYPEILDITGQKNVTVKSLDYSGDNTNRLLFQMEGIDGLKTGTTNRAGCCLVATQLVQNGNKQVRVIAVVLGAEDSRERAEKAGVLLEYAKEYYAK